MTLDSFEWEWLSCKIPREMFSGQSYLPVEEVTTYTKFGGPFPSFHFPQMPDVKTWLGYLV